MLVNLQARHNLNTRNQCWLNRFWQLHNLTQYAINTTTNHKRLFEWLNVNIRCLTLCSIIQNRRQRLRDRRILRYSLRIATMILSFLLFSLRRTVNIFQVSHILHQSIVDARIRSHHDAHWHVNNIRHIIHTLNISRVKHRDIEMTIFYVKRNHT